MKITKYEHAFLVIEDQGQRLVIDPGVYSASLPDLGSISGLVVTHLHADHFHLPHIDQLLAQNPGLEIYTTQEVAKELGDRPHKVVDAVNNETCGVFDLKFYGGEHAIIHSSTPVWQNIGVMVNDTLYYPGDSFTVPNTSVPMLAAPAGSPWAKIGEEMDFIQNIKPKRFFSTHNAHLSDIGQQGRDNWFGKVAEGVGAEYVQLAYKQSIDC